MHLHAFMCRNLYLNVMEIAKIIIPITFKSLFYFGPSLATKGHPGF